MSQEFIEFKLTTPLKKIYKGDHKTNNDYVECDKLYLKPPTYKHNEDTISLQQGYMIRQISSSTTLMDLLSSMNKNTIEQQKEEKNLSKEEKALEERQTIKQILLYAKADLNDYIKTFKKFALKEICYTDNKYDHKIKSDDFDKISPNDKINLISEYLRVFFIVSWEVANN